MRYTKPPSPLIEHLYSALHSEFGVIVRTNNVERLRSRLYLLRKEDPSLAAVSITTSPTAPDSELWIVRNGKDVSDAET